MGEWVSTALLRDPSISIWGVSLSSHDQYQLFPAETKKDGSKHPGHDKERPDGAARSHDALLAVKSISLLRGLCLQVAADMCFEWLLRKIRDPAPQIIIASGNPLSDRSRRSSRERQYRQAPGGIRKQPSTPRKLSPRPWRNSSSSPERHNGAQRPVSSYLITRNTNHFTTTLIRMVRRHDRQQLWERQRADIESMSLDLQERVDSLTLRIERLDAAPQDNDIRTDKHRLRQCINDLQREQNRLEENEVSATNMLAGIEHDQTEEEHDLLAAVDEYTQLHTRGAGDLQLNHALRESFRDAQQIRNLLCTASEDLCTARDELEALNSDIQATGKAVMSQRKNLKVCIRMLTRAMPARRRFLARTMRRVYSTARVALLEQGLMEARIKESSAARPVIAINDAPPEPSASPDDDDLERYESLRDLVEEDRKDHDTFGDTFAERWNQYFTANPTATRSDFDRAWYLQRRTQASNLQKVQDAFIETRDEVLRAGGDPLALRPQEDHLDVPEYAGNRSDDGKTESESSEVQQERKRRGEEIAPDVHRWMGTGDSGAEEFDDDEQEAAEHRSGDDDGYTDDGIAPWDSLSQQQRIPVRAERIANYRTQCGLASEH